MSMIKRIYNNTIRTHLPKKIAVLNGVPVRHSPLLDFTDSFPNYKKELGNLVRETVRPTDNVVEIGGGRGVMTVLAARTGASVTTYEPSERMLSVLRETLGMNPTVGAVEVVECVVGPESGVYGTHTGKHILPKELPAHDVLVMDCEGAEYDILEELKMYPRNIIVETHPWDYDDYWSLLSVLNDDREDWEYYEVGDVRVLKPGSDRHAVVFQHKQ